MASQKYGRNQVQVLVALYESDLIKIGEVIERLETNRTALIRRLVESFLLLPDDEQQKIVG